MGLAAATPGAPVGVASVIRPHGRWRVELTGRADHAGTTLLADRVDPMLDLAALVPAGRAGPPGGGEALATVGKLEVRPNAVNAIPSRVTAWLDVRADDAAPGPAGDHGHRGAGASAAIEESWTAAVSFDGRAA